MPHPAIRLPKGTRTETDPQCRSQLAAALSLTALYCLLMTFVRVCYGYIHPWEPTDDLQGKICLVCTQLLLLSLVRASTDLPFLPLPTGASICPLLLDRHFFFKIHK